MTNGDVKILTKVAFSEGGRVMEFTPSKDPRHVAQAIEWLKTRATNSKYVIVMSDKERFTLSDLLKSGDFGGMGGKSSKGASKGNRGDVAEGIFAAAITARFIGSNSTVTEQEVIAVIDKLSKNKPKQTLTFKGANKNKRVQDTVIFKINLAPANMAALTDKNSQARLGDLIQSSVKYANSQVVGSWSKMLYENNRYNIVEIIADGLVEQKTSKVDVRVLVNGKKTDINVSLKADDVKQFGQISGAGFDKQQLLWGKLFKLNIKKYENDYYAKVYNKDIFGGIATVYRGVVEDINKAINNDRMMSYKNLADGIKYFATLKDNSVSLVQLSKQEAFIYQFNNLQKLLQVTKLKASYDTSTSTPRVVISDERGNVLLYVRVKKETRANGIYIRNYIEKGKLLTQLAAQIAN
jgi:putative lipoic acid-binding regulatory protein